MHSSITGSSVRVAAVIVVALSLMPFLSGCSTLGIATTEDLEATETRLRSAQRATDTRARTNEQALQEMSASVDQLTEMQQQVAASIAELNEQFASAKTWLDGMELESMAESAQRTEAAALTAEQRSRNIVVGYLEWARKHRAMLDEQIKILEQATQGTPVNEP